MIHLLATDPGGLPIPAVYGIASFPIALLLGAVRWCLVQMGKKDAIIDKLNEKSFAQSANAIAQAERLAPLINDTTRVLNQAVDALAPRYKDR